MPRRLSRRGLFGLLAGAPLAPAALSAPAEEVLRPPIRYTIEDVRRAALDRIGRIPAVQPFPDQWEIRVPIQWAKPRAKGSKCEIYSPAEVS